MNFAKFVRTLFLQNTTGRLLLIIAVSIVVKEELANETVNYGAGTKAYLRICVRTASYQKRAVLVKFEQFQKNSFTDFLQNRCSEFYMCVGKTF